MTTDTLTTAMTEMVRKADDSLLDTWESELMWEMPHLSESNRRDGLKRIADERERRLKAELAKIRQRVRDAYGNTSLDDLYGILRVWEGDLKNAMEDEMPKSFRRRILAQIIALGGLIDDLEMPEPTECRGEDEE